jgi:hypothetical protein
LPTESEDIRTEEDEEEYELAGTEPRKPVKIPSSAYDGFARVFEPPALLLHR